MSRVRNPVMPEAVRDQMVYVCMVCSKSTEGFYGSWGFIGEPPKGTCSKSCEQVQEAKPKYPPSTLGENDVKT